MKTFLFSFLVGVFASLFLTPVIRDLARRHGWVDKPDGGRKSHFEAIPVGGGVVIYVCLLLSLALVPFLNTAISQELRESALFVLEVVLLAGAMMLIGLYDDSKNLRPAVKFGLQALVAAASWFAGFRILAAWGGEGTELAVGMFSLPLTVIWIVGVTNAFNLIDGIDGLAAGAAVFAMIAMAVVSITNIQYLQVLILSALAGSTLGFLRYNFNPASIFLGDSGSLLLGFMLALLSTLSSQKSSTAVAIAVPIVAFGLPVTDTAVSMVRRFVSGKPIFEGDRRHIHHILLDRGLQPRHVVILLYGVCGMFGLFSLLFLNPNGRAIGFALAVVAVFVWFGIRQLQYPELRELNTLLSRGIQNQRRLLQGSIAIRRMTDRFRTAQSLPDLLFSISETLGELDFSRAEIRIPASMKPMMSGPAPAWSDVQDDGQFSVIRWTSNRPLNGSKGRANGTPFPSELHSRDSSEGDLREFVLEFTLASEPRANGTGEALLLRLFHPDEGGYPYSAVSLLSGGCWHEFQAAFRRIQESPVPVRHHQTKAAKTLA